MKHVPKRIKFTTLPLFVTVLFLIFFTSTAWGETQEEATESGPLAVYVGPLDPLQDDATGGGPLAEPVGSPQLVGTGGAPLAEFVTSPLVEVIETALVSGTSVEALFAELFNTGESEFDIICAFLNLGIDPSKIIIVALDYGVSSSDVHVIAKDCGANNSDVQVGYSMAGEPFTTQAEDKSTEEYIYDPPSASQ